MDNKNPVELSIPAEEDGGIEYLLEAIKKLENIIDEARKKLDKWECKNADIEELLKFLDDYKKGLQILTAQRSIADYKIKINNDEKTLLEFILRNGGYIHSIVYNEKEYGLVNFEAQLREHICDVWKNIENIGLFKKEDRYLLAILLNVFLRFIIFPHKIVMKNGKEFEVFCVKH